MKRSRLFILLVIVLVLLSSMVLISCHKKIKNPDEPEVPPSPPIDDGIKASDFYDTANDSHTYRYAYKVKSGDILIYSDVNGAVSNPYNLDVQKASFTSGGNGLEYKEEAFEDVQIEEKEALNQAVLSAGIVDPATFLGVTGATNSKIKITIQNTSKELQKIEISYDITSSGTAYSVVVELSVE